MSDIRHFRNREYTESGGNARWSDNDTLGNRPNAANYIRFTIPGIGPYALRKGILKELRLHLTSTNSVTYQIEYLQSIAGANGSFELVSDRLFYSPNQPGGSPDPLQPNTTYEWRCLCTPFTLETVSQFYYNIAWSGAPGPVNGFMEVEGRREAYGGK
jgi:hypothetical protein